MEAARSFSSSPSQSALAVISSALARFQQRPAGRQHFGKQHHFEHAGGIGEGDKGIHLVVAAAPFRFLDHACRRACALKPARRSSHQAGIGRRAQPLQRRAIGIERMAGEIEAHGAEFLAQPFMRRPVGHIGQAQFFAPRPPPPNSVDLAAFALARRRLRPRPECGRNFPPAGGGCC